PDLLDHLVAGFALVFSPDRVLPADLRELALTRAGFTWAPASGGNTAIVESGAACQRAPVTGRGAACSSSAVWTPRSSTSRHRSPPGTYSACTSTTSRVRTVGTSRSR